MTWKPCVVVLAVLAAVVIGCSGMQAMDPATQDQIMVEMADSAGWLVGYAVGKSGDEQLREKVNVYWAHIRDGEFTIPMANEALSLLEIDGPGGAFLKYKVLRLASSFGVIVDFEIMKIVELGNIKTEHLDAAEIGYLEGFKVGRMEL
jgi:hypothetical protein